MSIEGQVVGIREGKFTFLEVRTGSSVKTFQVVCDADTKFLYRGKVCDFSRSRYGLWSLIQAKGTIQERPQKKVHGRYMHQELLAETVETWGEIDSSMFPIVPSATFETLRSHSILRPRDARISAVMRIRDSAKFAIMQFMKDEGVCQVDTPVMTTDDCEGAGEMFSITGSDDFFGMRELIKLTVSGQLHGEAAAIALKRIYTFGPTFRAEHSQTSRHLAEFWMVEPELCFIDFEYLRKFTVEFLKYIVKTVLKECHDDIEFLQECHQKHPESLCDTELVQKLEKFVDASVTTIRYREALELLKTFDPSDIELKEKIHKLKFGDDLESEMEKALTRHFDGIVIVTHYPKSLKSFYMMPTEDDPETVDAMDVLAPGIGEIVGGSMREFRHEYLKKRMDEEGVSIPWYLDLRKMSTVPHGGFGLGFERMVMYLSGIHSIHDTIMCPRRYKHAH